MLHNPSGCLYIEIGSDLIEEKYINKGIKLIKNNFKDNFKYIDKASVFCNLANGYMALANMEIKKEPFGYYFSKIEPKTYLDKAKKFYCKALRYSQKENKLSSELLVNYGICLTMNGRVIEAFNYYQKVLDTNKNFSKALLHYGLGLEYYSLKSSNRRYEHLRNSIKYLHGADQHTLMKTEKDFIKRKITKIENLLKNKGKLAPIKKQIPIDIKNQYEEFCYNKRLFLNFCFPCYDCRKSLSDSLFFTLMNIPKNKITNDISNIPPQVLSRYFNIIKVDFITARYLCYLYIKKPKDMEYINKKVLLVDTFNYSVYDSYTPLLKQSFKVAYDILDKIAFCINYYLDLNIKENRINYKSIWNPIQEKEAQFQEYNKLPNYNLQALYDIYKDLKNGDLKQLNLIRNLLTHRFFDICEIHQKRKIASILEEDFYEKTLSLLQVVKGAIYYLIMYIIEEENKKLEVAESTDIIAKMHFPTFSISEKCTL